MAKKKDYGDGIGLNLPDEPACSKCAFYVPKLVGEGRRMGCDDHVVESSVEVTVADDHNLNTFFCPPPDFSCSRFNEKET